MEKRRTDEEFFDALTDLFLAEGSKGLTIGTIAARMHCSRRRIYDVAQTKDEIFCTVVKRFFDNMLGKTEALIQGEQDVPTAIAAYLDVGFQDASRISVQFLKDVEDSVTARHIFDSYQQARTARLSQLIGRGVREGVFAPCHEMVVSEIILGAALRLRRTAFLAQAKLTLNEAFQEFYRVLLGGLMIDAAAPRVAQNLARTRRSKAQHTSVSNDDGANIRLARESLSRG